MAVRVLQCGGCDQPIVFEGKFPATCPHCHIVNWRARKDPKVPYTLTHNDKHLLLRRLRIRAED